MEFVIKSKKHGDRIVIVDDEDYPAIKPYKWFLSKCSDLFYAVSSHYGRPVKLHRVILKVTDPKILVDHKNGNPLDNRKENLRLCNKQQNAYNAKKRKRATSKYKGVHFDNKRQLWSARISTKNVNGLVYGKFLGYFTLEEDAAKAYNNAAEMYYGEFKKLNILGEV